MNENYINEPDEYGETTFHLKCNDIMDEISTTFRELGFTNRYLAYWRNKIYTIEEVKEYIRETLLNLDEFKRRDLNRMWAMLSDKNCWYIDYDIGELVHWELMKIWYPEKFA